MFRPENLFTVQSYEVSAYRPHFVALLERMEQHNPEVSPEDVFRQAERAEAQIWGYAENGDVRAMAVTRIHQMALGKLCSIWICVGEAADILHGAHKHIEDWARDAGCYAIEIVGRNGWGRVLPGYERKAVVYEKSLRRLN